MLYVRKLNQTEIKEIYDTHMQEAFPQSELRPYKNIEMLCARGNYICYGLYEGEALRAYAYFSKTNDRPYILLDYYAVLSGLRGTGIGSRFFPLLREELRDVCAILLEVESVESTEDENEKTLRRRRIAFYERNGCAVTNVKCELYGVDFSIMTMPVAAAWSRLSRSCPGEGCTGMPAGLSATRKSSFSHSTVSGSAIGS